MCDSQPVLCIRSQRGGHRGTVRQECSLHSVCRNGPHLEVLRTARLKSRHKHAHGENFSATKTHLCCNMFYWLINAYYNMLFSIYCHCIKYWYSAGAVLQKVSISLLLQSWDSILQFDSSLDGFMSNPQDFMLQSGGEKMVITTSTCIPKILWHLVW